MHVFAFTFLWTITEKDANYNIRRRLMINSKIPQGGLWHTKKVFFGVPFKFVINILKLLTYPGTYYEQCCAFKMTKISLGRYLNSQEKLKTMLMQNFGVPKKEHYGMLWYFLEWSILNTQRNLYWISFLKLINNS